MKKKKMKVTSSTTPLLDRYRLDSHRIQSTITSTILEYPSFHHRVDVITLLLETCVCCVESKSYHGVMVIMSALNCHVIYRLEREWGEVEKILPSVR